ncbi:hypothetical protein [Sediminibacillus halophilus]|uniref:Restriction endonuclease n=1 Tax=Sediminibacillus halophilus TaxID=482461 RepID=A0A1G9T6Q9_9BACI|nr:hypothetical protein [Sediminibacillus halophilus]SDM43326.1 hypothetical protein SAMN05216244_2455 [Sediminibacillus halophilus]
MNGGRNASRGFYLQALISVLESVRNTSWKNISVEPNEEKVDIEITYIDGSVKFIQVKSTKNSFKPSIIKEVIRSLVNSDKKATTYEVVLIGEFSAESKKMYSDSDVHNLTSFLDDEMDNTKDIKLTQVNLNIDIIESNVKRTLNEYLHKLGLEVNTEKLNMIHGSLIAQTLLASTNGDVLLKESFNDRLRKFVTIMNEDEKIQRKEIMLSPESKSFLWKRKMFRFIGLLLLLVFIISPIIKYFREGLGIFNIIGLIVLWIIILGTIVLFKISDIKFKKRESEELAEYSRNNNEAQNSILKLQVRDKIEFIKGNRKVYRLIELYNLTPKKIEYIQGDIYFYQGSRRIHNQDFSLENINSYSSVVVYDNYMVKEKSQKYWSKFTLSIDKSSIKELEGKELHSTSIYRNYDTLLNNNYLPVIEELFFYESSWAVEKLQHQYRKIIFRKKDKSLKGVLIVITYILLLIFSIFFGGIGLYNSLYIIFELIKTIF